MTYHLGDIYPGANRPITQRFGDNPTRLVNGKLTGPYAKFGLKGHDGIDIALPNDTPLLAAFDGSIVRVGWDQYGYGNYVEIWDQKQKCAVIYAHMRGAVVAVGQNVKRSQLIGFSDNTGNSTGAHLHFAVCATDANGIRLGKDNGYGGWLDPLNRSIAVFDLGTGVPHPDPVPPQPAPPKPVPAPLPPATTPGIKWKAFSGTVMPPQAHVRWSYGLGSPVMRTLGRNTKLSFDGWIAFGPAIADFKTKKGDNRWFHISAKQGGGWIASALINGNP